MSESESPKPIQPDPQNDTASQTESLGSIYVFVDAKLESVRRPADPVILEWIKQHQYLLQPPKKEGEEEKK